MPIRPEPTQAPAAPDRPPARDLPHAPDPHAAQPSRLQRAMLAFCILFGIALILNTYTPGDGLWYWCAVLIHSGKRLYADMHLPLQPLFVLETSWFMVLLGKGWLASKVPAVLHCIAYSVGLFLLVRHAKLSDGAKAIVLGAAFFLSIFSVVYRFDDYHVIADAFEVYALVVLLLLARATAAARILQLAAALGILSGLAIVNRVNDGAALLVGVAIALLCLAPSRRLAAFALFTLASIVSVLTVVVLTGDTVHDWLFTSILHAAGSKGGTGHVLAYPIHLPVNTFRWLKDRRYEEVLLYAFAAALAWALALAPLFRAPLVRAPLVRAPLVRAPLALAPLAPAPLASHRKPRDLLKAALALLVIVVPFPFLYRLFVESQFVLSMAALSVFILYALGALVMFRAIRWLLNPNPSTKLNPSLNPSLPWDRREILYLIPLGQLASLSTSSGGVHMGIYSPMAILIALLAIVPPFSLRHAAIKPALLALTSVLLVDSIFFKVNLPYSWHSYQLPAMFTDRQWYSHPVYGPMYIERGQLTLIRSVCTTIDTAGSQGELLSMPYPYSNYFCGIPPWHDYVQTFFDTSTRETIESLTAELNQSPPKWIFYQRQLYSLRVHELQFNHGQPLPHRALDNLIEQKLASGTWQVAYTSRFGLSKEWTNEWLLIRTR